MFPLTWGRRRSRRALAVRPCALRSLPIQLEDRCVPATLFVTTSADSGSGSLRAAVNLANSTSGPDYIHFNIPGDTATISLNSPLMPLTEKVIIDATTQPGYFGTPRIVINGQSAGVHADGLVFRENNFGSVVKGLSLVGFDGAAIKTTTTDPIIGAGAMTIQSNYIGVLPNGVTAKGNGTGIWLENYLPDGDGTLVGGSGINQGNVISGNTTGIYVRCWFNVFQGNKIGTDATGTVAVPNQVGVFEIAGFNQFGGTKAGEGNLISGNTKYGMHLDAALNAKVFGNRIGTKANGIDALGNGVGLYVGRSTSTFGVSYIGGTESGEGNVIAHNKGAGVLLPRETVDVSILGNSIFNNAGLGIDLSSNAAADGPSLSGGVGGNHMQRPPSLTSVTHDAGGTVVAGIVQGAPNKTYRVEIFANSQSDPSGYGEGQTFLGSTSVITNSSGVATFSAMVDSASSGQLISATASRFTPATEFQTALYETSEFSLAKSLEGQSLVGGTVSGRAFIDADIDGVYDVSELPKSDVLMYVDSNANGAFDTGEASTLTNAAGHYQFQFAANGQNLIRSEVPAGYALSTPGAQTTTVFGGGSYADTNFGFYLVSSSSAKVSGQVYRDNNINGVLDGSDIGWPGLRVFADLNSNGTYQPGEPQTISVDSFGSYELSVMPGTYSIRIDLPAGLTQTSTNPPPIPVSALQTVGSIHFGVIALSGGINISGRTFADANNNGKQDSIESVIGGVIVFIDANNDGDFDLIEPNGISNASGDFQFSAPNIQPGMVRMVEPTGYVTSTSPPLVQQNSGSVTGLQLGLRLLDTGGELPVNTITTLIATGADQGGGPHVIVRNSDGSIRHSFFAYDSTFTGGVRVATGDFNGDDFDDVITAPGPGGGPHIKVFDGKTGAMIFQTFAYAATFTGGVNIAAGDVDGDGRADIITGPAAGGGPHVRVFSAATALPIRDLFAYAATFTGGVNVGAGDVTGDGKADIITGPGAGGGPHVKVFNGVDSKLEKQLFAYPATFTGGVNVAAGDINNDGRADIITAPASNYGPNVKVFSGLNLTTLRSFNAFNSVFTGGVRIAADDIDGDGYSEILTGTGPSNVLVGQTARMRWWDGETGSMTFDQEIYPGFMGGLFVG